MINDSDFTRTRGARSDAALWVAFVLAYAAIAALTVFTF